MRKAQANKEFAKSIGYRIFYFISLLAVLAAISAFFLPYLDTTPEYKEYLNALGDESILESMYLTQKDSSSISQFKYAEVYFFAGDELFHTDGYDIAYGILLSLPGVLAVLMGIMTLLKKPFLLFILSGLYGAVCYAIDWDFIDRGILPTSYSFWGIAYYIEYICAIVLALVALWMTVIKVRRKLSCNMLSQ